MEQEKRIENLKAELKKIGITNEAELLDAIRKLPPLKLNIMTAAIVQQEGALHG